MRRGEAAAGALLLAYDARTGAAVEALRATLSPAAAGLLDQVVAEGAELAGERARRLTEPSLRDDAAAGPDRIPGSVGNTHLTGSKSDCEILRKRFSLSWAQRPVLARARTPWHR